MGDMIGIIIEIRGDDNMPKGWYDRPKSHAIVSYGAFLSSNLTKASSDISKDIKYIKSKYGKYTAEIASLMETGQKTRQSKGGIDNVVKGVANLIASIESNKELESDPRAKKIMYNVIRGYLMTMLMNIDEYTNNPSKINEYANKLKFYIDVLSVHIGDYTFLRSDIKEYYNKEREFKEYAKKNLPVLISNKFIEKTNVFDELNSVELNNEVILFTTSQDIKVKNQHEFIEKMAKKFDDTMKYYNITNNLPEQTVEVLNALFKEDISDEIVKLMKDNKIKSLSDMQKALGNYLDKNYDKIVDEEFDKLITALAEGLEIDKKKIVQVNLPQVIVNIISPDKKDFYKKKVIVNYKTAEKPPTKLEKYVKARLQSVIEYIDTLNFD